MLAERRPFLTGLLIGVLAAALLAITPRVAEATCVSSTATSQSFADGVLPDAEGDAPEIQSVEASLDATCGLTIQPLLASSALRPQDTIEIRLDVDGNPSTGDFGTDRLVTVTGTTGPQLIAWTGSDFDRAHPVSLTAVGTAGFSASLDQLGVSAPVVGIRVVTTSGSFSDYAPASLDPAFGLPLTFSSVVLSLLPARASGPTGVEHPVTATLLVDNVLRPNVALHFEVQGANPTSGDAVTDAGGTATFSYAGASPGTDTISVCFDEDADGACASTEVLTTATKQWASTFAVSLSPQRDVTLIGASHAVIGRVTGDGVALSDAPVHFSVGGSNAASGNELSNAAGDATFTYSGLNAGLDTITACYDVDEDGACGAGEVFSTAANRYFNNVAISLSPQDELGRIGAQQAVTAVLTGDGTPLADERVRFSVSGANSASGEVTTNASGEASFGYAGTAVGSDTILACFDANQDGVCPNGSGEIFETAAKRFISPAAGAQPKPGPSNPKGLVRPTGATKPAGCVVPKVKGLRVAKAKRKLRKAGCKFKVRGRGRVRSTSPRAGKRTAKTVVVRAKKKRR